MRTRIIAALMAVGASMAQAQDPATVVEIATMELADGVSMEAFAAVDARVEAEHVSQQPGFVARQTGATETGWVAIVHWASTEAAEASMARFATAPAAAEFMSMIDADSLAMARYRINP